MRLSLEDIFRTPVLKQMAAWIAQADQTKFEPIPRAPMRDSYPATEVQKQIYYVQQLQDDDVSYNMPVVFALRGDLDKARLEDAVRKLVERHEALRTSFRTVDGELRQLIHNMNEIETTILDMNELLNDEDDLLSVGMEKFVIPFDLAQAPLLRIGLLKMTDSLHYLALDTHHIVSDGASVRVLCEELFAFYRGEKSLTAPLQFKDYAEWGGKGGRMTTLASSFGSIVPGL